MASMLRCVRSALFMDVWSLVRAGYSQQLDQEDVPSLPPAFSARTVRRATRLAFEAADGNLVRSLWSEHRRMCSIVLLLSFVDMASLVARPLFLRQLLRAMENDAELPELLGYCAGMLLASISEGLSHTWYLLLSKNDLGLTIQTGEHSPQEDAQAALLLYLRFQHKFDQVAEAQKLKYQQSHPPPSSLIQRRNVA